MQRMDYTPFVNLAVKFYTTLFVVVLSCYASAETLSRPRTSIPLLSREGIDLLQRDLAIDFQPLRRNWVAQKKSHCGAASAVIVQNALRPGYKLTQDSLFTPETAHIITQETVYRIGFTLDELAAMIRARSALDVEAFHASDEDERSNYQAFIKALKANRVHARDHIILNYSRAYLKGEGTGKGHWSPVADYHIEKDRVLIMEVNASREPFWISSLDIYRAMHTIDKVSQQNRGWLIVRIE